MSALIDLTGKLENGSWNYGDPFPDIVIEKVATAEKFGYEGHAFRLHSLAGTYLETANHLFPDRETLGNVALERLKTRAWVAQLPDKKPLEIIEAVELEQAIGSVIEPGDALLIATGWDAYWGKPGFTDSSPYLSPKAMEWIIARDVSLLGMDITSIEDPRKPGDEMTLLAQYYAKDRLMVAPLVNLRKAGKGPWTLLTLPLNISDTCAAPCRAILLES
ncbi:cyclase family protein [Cohnella fermenti]|uniref:Cyclase family protein n=1 Tax=Cohnella fermenti TaxID=2565925 RepID=A0A4S4C922_9BACL|nr:cyclase family protein [Cohnella fermenti]THF84494.1 hypothetical protein E6C55_00475 [Cohnella fermenti]